MVNSTSVRPGSERGREYLGRAPGRGPALARGPNDPAPSAGIKAFDPETGKTVWDFKLFQGSLSNGVLATAGDVLFASSRDSNIIALDAKTGAHLWHYQTGGSHAASPISYALDGRQYIALTAGNVLFQFRVARRSGAHPLTSPIVSSMDPDACTAALVRMGLTRPGEHVAITPLPGGVSSEIARADLGSGVVCIKRALPRLKVQAHWEAPVERNRYEVEWIRTVNAIAPNAVPRILGDDPEGGMFAMEFLDGATHPVWKDQLRDGNISTTTARQVGSVLAAVHQHTAGAADTAAEVRDRPHLLPHPARAVLAGNGGAPS